ncbi:MAG TPA: VWA domain-containing protein, partial [Bacillota bacterium]|nr:VWA domain-containing protein [Bacillota bacterium]
MVINFQSPLALLIFIPIAAFIIFIYHKYKERKLYRGLAPLATRLLIILLIILALAGMELNILANEVELVFLADLSDSMRAKNSEIVDFITQAQEILPDNYKTGIIGFGKDAQVEQTISDYPYFFDFHVSPRINYTDMDAGLQRAEALFSPVSRKRIVLLTDGNENAGDGMMRARALEQRGIRVDGVLFDTEPIKEVQLSALELPTSIYQGEAYGVRVVIDSSIETSGILRLLANRTPIRDLSVELQKGINTFVFEEMADQTGTVIYGAELDVKDDTFLQNNRMSAYTKISGPPRLALVEGAEGEGRELAKILEAGGVEYRTFSPYTMPVDLDEMVAYDAVILANVDYSALGDEKAEMLNTYVRSLGKGLLTTGGDSSYILGGYLATPLEKLLPLDMELENKGETPDLALLLVIDKSGSMSGGQYGASKMDLAKEAAMRSLDVLREDDFIGVVAFDSMAYSVVDTQKVTDEEKIQGAIGGIQAGGGTNLYPGLEMALKSLTETEAAVKHVIVLTDGQTQGGDIDRVIGRMTDELITVTGVAIGEDADRVLMQRISELGNGRYYHTNDFVSIPKIFTRETYHAMRNYINNESFYPMPKGYSPILEHIDELPPLHGYITTTIKSGADLILVSDNEDPILASWDYGLGTAASWTSDASGIWTEDWMSWAGSADFWLNTISYILPGQTTDSAMLEVERDGNQGIISVRADEMMDADIETGAVVVGPGGDEREVIMDPIKPGLYQGNFELDDTGVYLVRAEQKQGDAVNVMETGLNYPYSPEYDMRIKSSRLVLEHIVSQTDGRILDSPRDLLTYEEPPVWEHTEVWPYLLLAALALFIVDIAARRLELVRLLRKAYIYGCKQVKQLLRSLGQLLKRIYYPMSRAKAGPNNRGEVDRTARPDGGAEEKKVDSPHTSKGGQDNKT